MFTQKILISALVLAAAVVPASASSCTSTQCTGSVASGSDSTDRTTFNSGNADLSFSNITFNDATGTYTAAGLNSTTAPAAVLDGTSFLGCFSSFGPCASNSAGLVVGDIGAWDGGTDPALQISNTNFGSGGNTDTITITLPANTYAFGVDIIDQNNNNGTAPFVVHVTSDMNTASPAVLPGSVFFAYRSVTPITTVSIYPQIAAEQMAIDNLEIGTQGAAATPEVATILLIGTGLVTLLYARKRRWLPTLSPA